MKQKKWHLECLVKSSSQSKQENKEGYAMMWVETNFISVMKVHVIVLIMLVYYVIYCVWQINKNKNKMFF